MKLSTRSLPTAPAVHAWNENETKAFSCPNIRFFTAAGKTNHRKCSISQRRHSYPNIKPSQTTELNQSTSAPSLLPSRRISKASPDHINGYHPATDRDSNPASDSLPSSISSSHPLISQNNDNDNESNLSSCSIGSPLSIESPRRRTISTSTQVSPFNHRPQTDSTPSGSVFSIIESVLAPAALESDVPISNAEFIVEGELNTINEINKIGREEFIEKYSLNSKDYGHKFSMKYNQLDTKKTDSTNECRGLVLSNDFRVLSMPFIRFSNYTVHTAKKLDWESAQYFEKTDGTMIQYYYDDIVNKWCVGTSGTAEAVDKVACRDKVKGTNSSFDFTLTDLFLSTCKELNIKLKKLEKGFTYIFELATEFNMVINTYKTSTIKLLGIRSTSLDQDYKELGQSALDLQAKAIDCERPIEYFFNSQKEMIASLKNVKLGDVNFEGYVIVDKNFVRLKVKSNTYVIFFQFNGDILTKWRLIDVVINNEIEEVSASFPSLTKPLDDLKIKYDILIEPVRKKFEYLKENYDSFERKDFFIEGNNSIDNDKKKKSMLGVFTSLFKDKNITFEKALDELSSEKIYKIVK